MDCFLCGGRRKTKRVTVPPGTNTLSVGPAAHAIQQPQAVAPCEYQLCLADHLHVTVRLDLANQLEALKLWYTAQFWP